ncbi:hypothetical protein ACFOLF_15540 [Paenibacillus sepulcri]|uniref:MmyB-like transcription regulator ligand binding domain-containing protein n=1 Tax=Paenibacillus sepulcri TaxID=359917 RepID=A0ABS7C7I1_9BACL|nr:hypothetical protein [Paenibacillus sepulcri]
MKRQRQYADQSHPSLKRFTQQELNDEACLTYKNLLVGRSHRLPDRQTMLRIAEYLECTSDERNDLLAAAGYLPILPEMAGRSLELALEQAHQLMANLSLPAMIVTPTLDIKEFNEPFRDLFDIPRELFYENRMNLIDFHFNYDLPIRARSTYDAASFEQWESHAINGIQTFKRNHLLSRHDDWYQRLIRKFHQYGDTDKYWNMEPKTPEHQENYSRIILARTESAGGLVPIRYRQVFLSAGSSMYPGIGVFLPVDEPARQAFAHLGCPAV